MSMTEKLAYIKKLRRMTTVELAQQSGVPLSTLNKILSGQTKHPAAGPMDRITQVLRVSTHYLLDDELPIECYLSASAEDTIVLLSTNELRFLMKYRRLKPGSQQTSESMLEFLSLTPGQFAGHIPVKRTLCFAVPFPECANPWRNTSHLRPVLILETDDASREADFTVLLTNGSMEPLYPAGTVLLCKRQQTPCRDYGLFRLNQEALVRRLHSRRGVTKLVAPNLGFKDIVVQKDDRLECIGAITGIAQGCRWEEP